ncbi:MAG: aspartate dehydrogenase [Arenicellales bacterium]|nr:aspartate dehydrogenase [Arenicellales bacterium]
MISIGMLGCGNIAGIIESQGGTMVKIAACYDKQSQRMESYAQRTRAQQCTDFDSLVEKDYSLLVEAASVDAVRDHLQAALTRGKDAVVLSVGAFSDASFLAKTRQIAAANGRRIYVPSGAIFGLDNIKVARVCEVDRLVLRTTKPPSALGIADTLKRVCVFRGTAKEAIQRFPRNINVSVALGLAAAVEPEVELWADPSVTANRHEIEATGVFGSVSITTDNVPSPGNPATSYLAALSVLTLLKNLDDPLVVGT